MTEVEIATHGATEEKSVGNEVWTSHRLPPTGEDNIEDMLKRSIDEWSHLRHRVLAFTTGTGDNDVRRQRYRV